MQDRPGLALGFAALAPVAVAAILMGAPSSVPNTSAALVLVVVVVVAGASGHRAAGLVAAVTSAAGFDFFLTAPRFSLDIAAARDLQTAGLLAVVGVLVAELAAWGRRQQAQASRRQGQLEGMLRSASLSVDATTTPEAALADIGRQIVVVLGAERCSFVGGPPSGAHPVLAADGEVRWNGSVVDVGRSGLPTFDVVDLPVHTRERVVARFVVTAATSVVRPDLDQRRTAVALADHAASAFAALPATAVPVVVPAGGGADPTG